MHHEEINDNKVMTLNILTESLGPIYTIPVLVSCKGFSSKLQHFCKLLLVDSLTQGLS